MGTLKINLIGLSLFLTCLVQSQIVLEFCPVTKVHDPFRPYRQRGVRLPS